MAARRIRRSRLWVLLALCGMCAAQLLLVLGAARAPFPFVTMSHVKAAAAFNAPTPSGAIDAGDGFRRRVRDALAPAVGDTTDVGAVSFALAVYVRSHLFHEQRAPLRDLQAVLDSDGEDGALCSGYARLLAAAAQALGYDARVVWMAGHTVSEINFPGRGWVLVDSSGNLMFKDAEGNWAGALDVVEHLDEVVPARPADRTDNDPDFMSSGRLSVYARNPVLVVIEGARVLDFDARSKSPGPALRYVLLGRPVARGIQYTGGGRPALGNAGRLIRALIALDVAIVLVLVVRRVKHH